MRKFESSQKDESRTHSADSSKTYRKPGAFICRYIAIWLQQTLLNHFLMYFNVNAPDTQPTAYVQMLWRNHNQMQFSKCNLPFENKLQL